MKKHKVSNDHNVEMVKVKGQTWKFSPWLWPYLVIPSCVAALIALFFFVIIPPPRHGIGNFGVGFWLSAFAIWIIITFACTMLWIFAGRHLLKSDYYLISYIKTEQDRVDQIGVIENSRFDAIIETGIKSKDKEQCMLSIEEKIMKDHDHDDDNMNGGQTLLLSKLSEPDFDLEDEKHVVHEKVVHSSQTLSVGQHNIPECHPPRRVSYAGVIAVEIPPTEELESDGDDPESDSKLRVPRPPTPRFPRGMRVLSAEKCSAKYTEVSLHQQQQSTSSEPPNISEIFHFGEKKVFEPRVSGEIEHVVLGKINSPSLHLEDKPLKTRENGVAPEYDRNSLNKYSTNREGVSHEQRGRTASEMVDFKRRHFSDEENRSTSIDRNKRMSMDRNQFLGWNPDQGILAEADPGSREREERRWRKSLGAWHRSISASCHEDSKTAGEIDDEEELDDVFQDRN